MKYLCLISAETLMEQMPEADAEKHLEEYFEFTEANRSGRGLAEVSPSKRCRTTCQVGTVREMIRHGIRNKK